MAFNSQLDLINARAEEERSDLSHIHRSSDSGVDLHGGDGQNHTLTTSREDNPDIPSPDHRNRAPPLWYTGTSRMEDRPQQITRHYLPTSATLRFYESLEAECNQPMASGAFAEYQSIQKDIIKQSRRVPAWVWKFLSKVLGIKSCPEDNPWISAVLYGLTLFFASVLSITGVWYNIMDIKSQYSKTTLLTGFVNLLIGFGWISLGIYSNKLAGKLMYNKNFSESVRIHSRTFLKISAAGLLILAGGAMISVNSYSAYSDLSGQKCQLIGVFPIVCQLLFVSRVVFGVVSLMWNLLVGCVLLSVCRTHTIGVRKFLQELEEDADVFEDYWRVKLKYGHKPGLDLDTVSLPDNSEWFIWDDRYKGDETGQPRKQSFSRARTASTVTVERELLNLGDGSWEGHTATDAVVEGAANTVYRNRSTSQRNSSCEKEFNIVDPQAEVADKQYLTDKPPIMSSEDILLSYWKISNRMRITSHCLQRWLASWLAFDLIWCSNYVIYWIKHEATLVGISEFILPLLILLLLASAYAEANGEGQRMIRCICPTKDRFGLLYFLVQQPLQMQVFNISLTYNALLAVILAFAVAFASRIILDEVMK